MHLRGETEEAQREGGNDIEGAQIGVVCNLPKRRAEILADKDGVLASIEGLAQAA